MASVVGKENVVPSLPPSMGAEDFAWMLRERPGCYLRLGNGSDGHGSCVVHNSRYDVNDNALPVGASFWAALVEQELPPKGAETRRRGVELTDDTARTRASRPIDRPEADDSRGVTPYPGPGG